MSTHSERVADYLQHILDAIERARAYAAQAGSVDAFKNHPLLQDGKVSCGKTFITVGQVAVTAPTAGTTLTSAETADAFCSSALGTGWRMAEFHDGKGGWGFVARGHISSAPRFWVRINDQPGNCWDSGSDAAVRTAPKAPLERRDLRSHLE